MLKVDDKVDNIWDFYTEEIEAFKMTMFHSDRNQLTNFPCTLSVRVNISVFLMS